MRIVTSDRIPVAKLKQLFTYDAASGRLWGNVSKKFIEGSRRRSVIMVSINWQKKKFRTNYGRVVFALCHGRWPVTTVDHINRDFTDNRIENLREATDRQQSQNTSTFKGGAWLRKRDKRWVAYVRIDGVQRYLGSFSTQELAQDAYLTACNALEEGRLTVDNIKDFRSVLQHVLSSVQHQRQSASRSSCSQG